MASRKKKNSPRKPAKKNAAKKKPIKKKSVRKTKKKAEPKSKGPAITGPPPPPPPADDQPRGGDRLCICMKKGSRWFCMKRDDDGKLIVCDGPFPTKEDCEENAICDG